jgi:hypothetical protein
MNYLEQRATVLGQGNLEKKNEWAALLDRILENTGFLNTQIREHLPRKLAYFDLVYDDLVYDSTMFRILNPGFNIFKDSLSAFRKLYSIQYPANSQKSYDHLISMVGLSLEPIMHTILTICPKSITLCVTDQSKEIGSSIPAIKFITHAIKEFRTDTSYNPDIDVLSVDHSDTAKIFAKVNGKMNGWLKDSKNIALDITGGKKSMDVTAFLAATMYQGIDIYYVDFEGYENGNPVYGSEFLSKLINPYHFFSIREKQLIHDLWERKNYAEVKKLFDELLCEDKFSTTIAQDYSLQEEYKKLENLQKAAACYDAWRKFDYLRAIITIDFIGFNKFHDSSLSVLSDCQNIKYDAQGVLCLAIDRFVRGTDAEQLTEWDMAAVHYMQAVEIILSYSLWRSVKEKVLLGKGVSNYDVGEYKSPKYMLDVLFGVLEPTEFAKMYAPEKNQNTSPVFGDKNMHERLKEDVLDLRNKIAHFNCPSCSEKNGMDSAGEVKAKSLMLQQMRIVVDNFIFVFADKYRVDVNIIDSFKRLVTFPRIDKHLHLCA